MKEQIVYRAFQNGDRPALEEVIRETWQYDKFCGPKTAAKLAKVYLDSCLANQTFTQVAVVDGVPAGIIMGKNISTHKCPLALRLRQIASILSFYFSKEGRTVSEVFSTVGEIDKDLLKNSPVNYQGEIAFFAVNSKYRGMGLGKKLFQEVKSYMKGEEIHNYFLFTDTSCDYEFYEHQGMVRRGEEPHTFHAGGQSGTLNLFIYEGQCG